MRYGCFPNDHCPQGTFAENRNIPPCTKYENLPITNSIKQYPSLRIQIIRFTNEFKNFTRNTIIIQ